MRYDENHPSDHEHCQAGEPNDQQIVGLEAAQTMARRFRERRFRRSAQTFVGPAALMLAQADAAGEILVRGDEKQVTAGAIEQLAARGQTGVGELLPATRTVK